MNARLRAALFLTILILLAGATFLVLTQYRNKDRSFTDVLDVNASTESELDEIPWMTPQMAAGIVSGRPWTNLNDLVDVSGIGEKTLEKIRPHLEL